VEAASISLSLDHRSHFGAHSSLGTPTRFLTPPGRRNLARLISTEENDAPVLFLNNMKVLSVLGRGNRASEDYHVLYILALRVK